MKIWEIKKKAMSMGLKVDGMGRVEMIRAIQSAEGNFPCFRTAAEYCDQVNCAWREDCLPKKV